MPNPKINQISDPDSSPHTLSTLMAALIQGYIPQYGTVSVDWTSPQDYRERISTYNCNDEPLQSHIDAAIEGYLQHLPQGAQSELRKLWQLTYAPPGSKDAYYVDSYVRYQLSGGWQTRSIPLALMFTLVWQAIQDESAWPVSEGSTPEAEKALRIAQFHWINQIYFSTNDWSNQPPSPWLQLLDGYQHKSLNIANSSKPRPIDVFLSRERREQMDMLEKIYDETWLPDAAEVWANSFVDYWHAAAKSQDEIMQTKPRQDDKKEPEIHIIQARLFSLLAMLHYRAETHPSDVLTRILDQIHSKIQVLDATLAAPASSTSTSEQTVGSAEPASELAERLRAKSLRSEDSIALVEYVARSPQMPANAITWLLSKEHNLNPTVKKEAKKPSHPKTPLDLACHFGHPALTQHLLDIDTSESALERKLSALKFAAHHRDLTIINLLWGSFYLAQPTDNDKQSWAIAYAETLSEAAGRGHIVVFRQLLEHFSMLNLSLASVPDLKLPSVSYRGHYFRSLLLWAIACGHSDIVQGLLDSGADMHKSHTVDGQNTCNIGVTPLSASALYGQVESLRFMLIHAGNHNQMPDADYINLLVRQDRRHPAIISLLIERDLFVFSGAAPAVGQTKFPYLSGVIDGGTHQAIANLASPVYQPIVQGLIQYIRTRDALQQPVADYLAEHWSIGYPKAVKLRVAHQLVAAMLSENPHVILSHLSEHERGALQQGKLGRLYHQAYQLISAHSAASPSVSFSDSQQMWHNPGHAQTSPTTAPASGHSPGKSGST